MTLVIPSFRNQQLSDEERAELLEQFSEAVSRCYSRERYMRWLRPDGLRERQRDRPRPWLRLMRANPRDARE